MDKEQELRDYFAGQALSGYANLPDFYDRSNEALSKMAYEQAE